MPNKSGNTTIRIPFEAADPGIARPEQAAYGGVMRARHRGNGNAALKSKHRQALKPLEWPVAGLAHEFNNIFSVILSNMELAQMKSPENICGYIERTLAAVRRGKEMVQHIQYSSQDNNRPELIDTGMLARKMVELLNIENPKVKTVMKATPGLWKVFGAPSQIQQAVMGLLMAARESSTAHNGSGPRLITVSLENIVLPPESIKIRTVVSEFIRLTITWDGGMAGTGNSGRLCLAEQALKDLGGWMEVVSNISAVTAFFPGQPDDPCNKMGHGAMKGGCETILLVEDERDVAEAVKELLETLGYTVFIAFSGEEALNIFNEKSGLIDMAILDMALPGIPGTEVLQIFKQIKPGIKAILSSGAGSSGKIADGTPFEFICKPYDFEELAHAIREAFGEGNAGGLDLKYHVNRIRSYFVREKTAPHSAKLLNGLSIYRIFGRLAWEPKENFIAVFLDAQKNLIAYDVVSRGTTDEATVYPQEIVRSALLAGAAAIALVHNHPSGMLEPSAEDIRLTLNVKTICRLLRIELADHVIISKSGYFSFSGKNML
ncbi:MAG: response regulator [Actinomycetota bacterium]|nr:response regulator [Actinomycetota bacterium]